MADTPIVLRYWLSEDYIKAELRAGRQFSGFDAAEIGPDSPYYEIAFMMAEITTQSFGKNILQVNIGQHGKSVVRYPKPNMDPEELIKDEMKRRFAIAAKVAKENA